MQTDVLIVDGGPAGLATAIAARSKGLRVTLLDHRAPPIDKACGEGLLPEAVVALRMLGIELNSTFAHPFAGLRFSDGHLSASAKFSKGKAFGVRRTVLHQLLVDRADEAGVAMLWQNQNFTIRIGHGVRRRQTHFLPVARRRGWSTFPGPPVCSIGLANPPKASLWIPAALCGSPVELFCGRPLASGCQLVVTPTNSGEVCVSMLTNDSRLRMDATLQPLFPGVAKRLHGAPIMSNEAGALTSLGRARSVRRGNVALVGDASSTVDGIAGQGLSLAFKQALHLAEALAAGDLASYQTARARLVPYAHAYNAAIVADERERSAAEADVKALRTKTRDFCQPCGGAYQLRISRHSEACRVSKSRMECALGRVIAALHFGRSRRAPANSTPPR